MRILTFEPEHRYGGVRMTISRSSLGADKIESLQVVELTRDLREPYHLNARGVVICLVLDGWMEAEVDAERYKVRKGQAIIFKEKERHRIIRGKGIMLSISSEHHDLGLGTIWEQEVSK